MKKAKGPVEIVEAFYKAHKVALAAREDVRAQFHLVVRAVLDEPGDYQITLVGEQRLRFTPVSQLGYDVTDAMWVELWPAQHGRAAELVANLLGMTWRVNLQDVLALEDARDWGAKIRVDEGQKRRVETVQKLVAERLHGWQLVKLPTAEVAVTFRVVEPSGALQVPQDHWLPAVEDESPTLTDLARCAAGVARGRKAGVVQATGKQVDVDLQFTIVEGGVTWRGRRYTPEVP